MALCPAAANDQDMDKRYLKAGSGLLAVGVVLAIWDLAGGVGLKTGGLDLGGITACYASGTSGLLVADAWAGTAIIEQDGDRYPVTWPIGFTGRRVSGEVEVVDSRGNVVTRTGTRVDMSGGYHNDGSFLACGDVR